jgi:pantetheine-phosphate adenylyltransferase
MRSALVYGTFDPLTSGHLWLVSAGLRLFDRIVVAVAPVVGREPVFTTEERLILWSQSLHGWGEGRVRVVVVGDESEARLAREHGCGFVLAGVRNLTEYIERSVWQRVLHDLAPAIQPVYLFPDARVADISAARVRDLVGRDGWVEAVKPYLQVPTWEALYRKYRRWGGRRVR